MPEPVEPPLRLPRDGAWPASLIEISIDDRLSAELAACEVAGAARRLRQGVRAVLRGYGMIGYPHESADTIKHRWLNTKIAAANAAARFQIPGEVFDGRWTTARKLAVLVAIGGARLTHAEALERWALSREEIEAWSISFERFGIAGLSSTRLRALGR
jgi:hypothetical protein